MNWLFGYFVRAFWQLYSSMHLISVFLSRWPVYDIHLLLQMSMLLLQLLDVFGHRSNVSLVFDFMDTDLEVDQCFVYVSFSFDFCVL